MAEFALPSQGGASQVQRDTGADWLAVLGGILGAFMAVLDVSVTNSSLPQIQGEIGATGSEGSWIGTGYLVAEIIMIPLSAWLGRVLGFRNFMLLAVSGFVLFSLGCGISSSLVEMIICRVGQGFTGGALIPTAMTIISVRLSPAKQPFGMALFALTAITGPVFGPLLGGWLTESVNWHYIFFMNLPVGICLIALLALGLPYEKSRIGEFANADFLGIAGLVLGLGGFTIMMEEGQREQWFESSTIVTVACIAGAGAMMIAASQFTTRDPVLRLRLLRDRGLAASFVASLIVGAALYAIPYILPVFLATVAGYNAEQTGQVVLIAGIPSLILLPMSPFLVRIMDLRLVATIGILFFALSCFLNIGMTVDTGIGELAVPQLLRGVGQALVMTPLNQSATAGVDRENAGDAAGLYSMARNLGGSLGLALMATMVDFRTVFHVQQLSQATTMNNLQAQAYIDAGGNLASTIHLQALVMSYSDCFFILGIALIAILPVIFTLRPLSGPAAASAH